MKDENKTQVCGEKCCPNACNDGGTDCKECVAFYKIVHKKHGTDIETIECCDELVENVVGSLSARGYLTYSGAKKATAEGRLYCCPKNKLYTKTNTCCGNGYQVSSDGCCPSDKVYIEGGEKKCCSISGEYGDVYANGTKCCKGQVQNGQCLCPKKKTNNSWYEEGCKKCEMVNGEPTYVPDPAMVGKDCNGTCGRCQANGSCKSKMVKPLYYTAGYCCVCEDDCKNWCHYCEPNGECDGTVCSIGPEYTAGVKNTMCWEIKAKYSK